MEALVTQNVSLPPAPKSSIQSEAPEMASPHLAALYVRQARNGDVAFVDPEDVYDVRADTWLVPQSELYTPEELGLHPAQVLRCLSDMVVRSRLGEEQMALEEDGKAGVCTMCEMSGRLCTYCRQAQKSLKEDHLRTRIKLAEIDARFTAVLTLAKAALPAAKERRSPSVVQLLRKPVAVRPSAAAGGAGAAPLPDLWSVPYDDTIEAFRTSGAEGHHASATCDGSIEALIEEILRR